MNFQYVYFSFLFIEILYLFHSGCKETYVNGKQCMNGNRCSGALACKKCTFEECKAHAETANSVAFSYGGNKNGHPAKECRLCDPGPDLQKSFARGSGSGYWGWGLYKNHGKFHNMLVINIHLIAFNLAFNN